MTISRYAFFCITIIASIFVGSMLMQDTVLAADARNFNPGKIIDDSVFTNSSSMTVDSIQAFLNSKVTCDTWGVKRSELGGGTRAQWMASRGISPPFRCITDYRENPTTGENNYGKSSNPAGSISAAEIIYNYSRQFNVNPQVIIATLQKENGMITDEWPTPKQFSEAMGFGCPDNVAPGAPACDPQYGSFSAQIYQANRHFRGYINNAPGWWVPYNTGQNTILWSPNTSCGSSIVDIQNRATVALYSYTPYRPNQAALNAQYATGDGCSAYGNRNFYLYFTDWFGSVYGDIHMVSSLTLLSSSPGGLYTKGFVEASFVLRNDSDQWKDVGTVAIAARDSSGNNYDFGAERITLAPHQEYLYRHARDFPIEGKYDFWVTSYRDGIGWNDDYPSATNGSVRKYLGKTVQNKPTLSATITNDSELRIGKTSNVTFTVNNNSIYPTNLGYIGVAMKGPSGENSDLAFDTITGLAPNTTYTYSKQFTPRVAGTYSASVASYVDGRWYADYPAPQQGVSSATQLTARPSPTLTQGLQLLKNESYVGDTPSISFKIKNFGDKSVDVGTVAIAVRDPDNRNADIGGIHLVLSTNQEYTFSSGRTFTKPGRYTAWLINYKDGLWNDIAPISENNTVQRKITFTVKSTPTLTEGITVKRASGSQDGQTIRAGDTAQGSFKVKNNGSSPVVVNKHLCYILRDASNRNYDLGCLEVKSLAPGQELTFAGSRVLPAGSYRAYFSMYDGQFWYDNWSFEQETGTEPKSLNFSVRSSPTLAQGLAIVNSNPRAGDTVTGSFKIINKSNASVVVNKHLCYILRDASNRNYDLGCLEVKSLAPGQELTFAGSRVLPAGSYRAYFSMYDGQFWYDNWSFEQETGTEPKSLNFSVSS